MSTSTDRGESASGPLRGIRVIELAAIGPVPFCAMMLSDMGAEVIRVDRAAAGKNRSGGITSQQGNPLNRGRRSIALNLKNPAAVEVLLRLADGADILIEGFRPGVMERLGLAPDICHARNPRLVYGRMTGWGQTGPLAHAAGHDINYIALSGALAAMGAADRPPTPPLNLVGDFGGGAMYLLAGLLAALIERQSSGAGQVIDAAMTDGAASLLTPFYGLLTTGQWTLERAANRLDGGAHYYGCYECQDGRFIAIGAIEPQFYSLLLRKCGLGDEAFARQDDPRSWPELRERLARLFKTRSRAQWCELLEGTDACFAPVLDMGEAPAHPHHQARGTFAQVDGVTQPAPAPRFSRTPGRIQGPPAAAGEHSEEILAELGLSAEAMARLLG